MIRPATAADIPAILNIYGPYVLNTGCSFEYTAPTEQAFRERFAHHTAFCPWLVWEEAGTVLGYAYGAPAFERAAYSWCAEISIYLAPQAQGRGIGRRLYGALEKLLFGQGYRVLYALVTSENAPSLAFHRALGYRQFADFESCGVKFGRWLGVIWLEKRKNSVEIPTKLPDMWSEIVKDDEKLKNILAILSLS